MTRMTQLLLFLFTIGVSTFPHRLLAQTTQVPVILSICTGLPATDVVDFSADVNRFTSVANVSVVLSCGTISPLLSNDQMLSLSLFMENQSLFLRVQPNSDPPTASEESRQRKIAWTDSLERFIDVTRESGKITTLALLIDNMVLDYAGIRLSPKTNEITDDFFVGDSDSAAAGNSATTARRIERSVDNAPVRAVSCNCDKICEKKLVHLRMTLDNLDAKSCAERFPVEKMPSDYRYTIVGASGGVNFFTSGNIAPQTALDVLLVRSRLGLVMRLGMMLDSSFEIANDSAKRPFDTRTGEWSLGPGGFWDSNRISFSLQALLVFRYWDVVRADISGARHQRFLDMGPGVHGMVMLRLGKIGGVFLRVGAQFFPAARRIVVENGPKARLGLFHFPFDLGFFVRF